MRIEELDLEPVAKGAATQLLAKHPEIKFTSGRRTVEQQAHAMASNIVSLNDREWIGKTYLAAAKLQAWVDDHLEAKTVDEISQGLTGTMKALPESELLKISKHLTGKAFDIRPVQKNAAVIKSDIRALPGLKKFLDKEGGHVRWHAQF